jgi:triosephosphate isomerase
MPKLFIAGNWKMNLDAQQSRDLAADLAAKLAGTDLAERIDIAVCPPFVYLDRVGQALGQSGVALGAQDVYFEPNGAFTGEISVEMIEDIGCSYVIVGHSERRHVLGESDELVNRKARAALDGGLELILCIGELLQERERNETKGVIERHVRTGLQGVSVEQMARVTIAYEPVWAIGTGKTATPDQAQEAHAYTRSILADMFGNKIAQRTRIQYGGSVKPDNAADLLGRNDVDGALVGGASLKLDSFFGIIAAGAKVK